MRPAPLAFMIASLIAIGGCKEKDKELYVDGAWVNLPAANGKVNPAVVYFTIHGGKTADALIGVTSQYSIRSEMHESIARPSEGNRPDMMLMSPLTSIPVPAHGTVRFAPGGKHVMLYQLRSTVVPGSTLQLTVSFASGNRLLVDAPVLAAGQSPAK